MSDLEDREIQGAERNIYELGVDWFTWKDDITREELGKQVKTYHFHLSYRDYFEVTVYEHGAEGYYTSTGRP